MDSILLFIIKVCFILLCLFTFLALCVLVFRVMFLTTFMTASRLQDCRSQLYESYYLNFITAISRHRLEDLATAALQANCVTQISRVRGSFLSFLYFCILYFKHFRLRAILWKAEIEFISLLEVESAPRKC